MWKSPTSDADRVEMSICFLGPKGAKHMILGCLNPGGRLHYNAEVRDIGSLPVGLASAMGVPDPLTISTKVSA